MANAKQDYEKLVAIARQQKAETGKVDPKVMSDKAQAGAAVRAEERAEARKAKPALQEAYIQRFPESQQPDVRKRLMGKGR